VRAKLERIEGPQLPIQFGQGRRWRHHRDLGAFANRFAQQTAGVLQRVADVEMKAHFGHG
jgi:hypothetical protein